MGVFFTRGVDSWGTLLERSAGPRREQPSLLINARLDVHHDPAIHARALVETRRVAAELGLPLAVVRSDVRQVLDPYLDWGSEVHGSVFAGLGYLLRRTVDEVVISPTHWTRHLRPWGSHPDLEPAWSLPDLRVTHHPGDEPRWERVARIAEHPLVATSLEVCWRGTRDRNCGRCDKCLRTMVALEVCGHPEVVEACFDEPLDPEAIGPGLTVYPQAWCETLDNLDHHGLRTDPMRQRWEQTVRQGRDGIFFQTRPIQPRLPVASEDRSPAELLAVGRVLAPLGLRVDHERIPAVGEPALAVRRLGGLLEGATVGLEAPVRWAPLRALHLDDLGPLLAALGADPAAAVPFDPDRQAPPPLVATPPDWPETASADPPHLG